MLRVLAVWSSQDCAFCALSEPCVSVPELSGDISSPWVRREEDSKAIDTCTLTSEVGGCSISASPRKRVTNAGRRCGTTLDFEGFRSTGVFGQSWHQLLSVQGESTEGKCKCGIAHAVALLRRVASSPTPTTTCSQMQFQRSKMEEIDSIFEELREGDDDRDQIETKETPTQSTAHKKTLVQTKTELLEEVIQQITTNERLPADLKKNLDPDTALLQLLIQQLEFLDSLNYQCQASF